MSRKTQREVIEQRIRLVNQLENELKIIRKAQFELGYIELQKPIRDGWYKTIKLRDDMAKSKKAKIFQEVLDAVLVEVWGREKKIADRNWKKYFNRSLLHYQRPGIKRLDEKVYNTNSVLDHQ